MKEEGKERRGEGRGGGCEGRNEGEDRRNGIAYVCARSKEGTRGDDN